MFYSGVDRYGILLLQHLSAQHLLTPGDRNGLSCFVLLFDHIVDSLHHVGGEASSSGRDLRFIMAFNVVKVFGSPYFSGFQVLDEEPVDRV